MDAISITGCWEGALLTDHGGFTLPFSLQQPPRTPLAPTGPTLRIGADNNTATRLLDGAAQAIVALVDGTHDPVTGRIAQLLFDARVRGDRLVGHWVQRDDQGHVLQSGQLSAGRIANG
jgi:hypothetical protein